MITKRRLQRLAICLLLCFGVSSLGGFFTQGSIDPWYTTLNRPLLTPPGWLFGPVWTLLYAMMAIALWLVWESPTPKKSPAITAFGIQLALNALWSPLFFYLKNPGLAFIEIILLWISIIATLYLFKRHSKTAALLLVPYLLWVSFAVYLNLFFWLLNA